MTLRSPIGTLKPTLPSIVGKEANLESQLESRDSYASVATKTNEKTTMGRHPPVVVDFSCDRANAYLPWSVLADFIFTDLRIRKSEILSLMTSRGIANATVRIATNDMVNVKARFGGCFEFKRMSGGIHWKCVVRGAQRFFPLRYHHVYGEVSLDDLAQATASFAEVKSSIMNEFFEEKQDARLCGIPNGNMRVLIHPIAPIPEFIVVGTRKIRISHRDQIRLCFRCRANDHLKNNCPLIRQVEGFTHPLTTSNQRDMLESVERLDPENGKDQPTTGVEDWKLGEQDLEQIDQDAQLEQKNQDDQQGEKEITGDGRACGEEKEEESVGEKEEELKNKRIYEARNKKALPEDEIRENKSGQIENMDASDCFITTRSRSKSIRNDPNRGVSDGLSMPKDRNDPNLGVRGQDCFQTLPND